MCAILEFVCFQEFIHGEGLRRKHFHLFDFACQHRFDDVVLNTSPGIRPWRRPKSSNAPHRAVHWNVNPGYRKKKGVP